MEVGSSLGFCSPLSLVPDCQSAGKVLELCAATTRRLRGGDGREEEVGLAHCDRARRESDGGALLHLALSQSNAVSELNKSEPQAAKLRSHSSPVPSAPRLSACLWDWALAKPPSTDACCNTLRSFCLA